MSSLDELIRASNPIPDPRRTFDEDRVDRLLTLAQQRSEAMDVEEIVAPVEPDPKKHGRGWMVAVAAAAVVVAAVGLAVVLQSGEGDTPPATTPEPTVTTTLAAATTEPTTTTIPSLSDAQQAFIEAYETAFNTGDADVFRALFEPGALRQVTAGVAEPLDEIVAEMTRMFERQTRVELAECQPIRDGVRCTTTLTGPIEDALYNGRVTNSGDRYLLGADGLVTAIEWGDTAVYSPFFEEQFVAWLAVAHPDVAAQLRSLECCANPLYAWEVGPIHLEWAPRWVELGRPSADDVEG